jgi:hypothetical protein
MKKMLLILVLAITTIGFSQTPEKMSYQAIVRDANGDLLSKKPVGMQISILQNSTTGAAVYIESHTITTNINGLVTLEIGTGTIISGNFSTIDWGVDSYFIKTEIDIVGGTSYSISGTSQLLSVPYALHAKTADNVKNYKVGDFKHGGIVFWVDETGQHGLVCSKNNQSISIKWFGGTFGTTQAKGNGLYAGKTNNTIIIATHAVVGDNGDIYAARLCNELEVVENNTLYGDWYLPSRYELNLMYKNKVAINTTAAANGGEDFVKDAYWSSTEESENKAWVLDFSNGNETPVLKSIKDPVRAIRSF